MFVNDVTDGDTFRTELQGRDEPIRMSGIDTPEVAGPHTSQECFGQEASEFATHALEGTRVVLEFDVERQDPFDRTLAYVWMDGELFNETLVRLGYARVTTFPPNVRYVARFEAAEDAARRAGRGMWGAC